MYGKGPGEVDGAPEFEAPANVVHRGRRIDRGVYSSGKGTRTDALLFIILVEYFKPRRDPRICLQYADLYLFIYRLSLSIYLVQNGIRSYIYINKKKKNSYVNLTFIYYFFRREPS